MFTRLARTFIVPLLLAATAAAQAPPQRIVWGVDGAGANTGAQLHRLNETNGAATAVGATGFGITGLAVDPTTGTLYGATNSVLTTNRGLVTIDRATGTATGIGDFAPVSNITDLTFDATGQLFGWSDGFMGPKDAATIDKATGAVTIVGESGLTTLSGNGLAFCGSTLYVAPEGPVGALFTIDPLTGAGTVGVTLTGSMLPGESISALACRIDGTLLAASLGTDVGASPGTAHLIEIPFPGTAGTIVDRGQTVDKLDALAIDEVIVATATAMPASTTPGVTVMFAATALATSPTTVTWDFGDGMMATGASVGHAFATPGMFAVTVTADATGPVRDQRTIMVDVAGGTTTTTTTSTTTTTTATTTTSTTTTTTSSSSTTTLLPPLPLTVDKLRVTLNFAKTGKDAIVVKGSLALPVDFLPTGQTMTLDVGGATGQATLNKKGKGPGFQVKKSGKFTAQLKRGSFADDLADEGLTNETVTAVPVSIEVLVGLGGQVYEKTQAATYTAKAGKTGKAK